VTLLEARERWTAAAELLGREADPGGPGGARLARAARDHLKAGDRDAAERALVAALLRAPERGDLYRDLAVEVYGARGDFDTAESVLRAGERNALDVVPVYQGVTRMLAQRQSARVEAFVAATLRVEGEAEP
jgi:hypothetical protein